MVKELPPPGLLHRRPYLIRQTSAAARLEHAEQQVHEAYQDYMEVFGRHQPVTRRLGRAAREAAHDVEERVEAGAWRLAMRAALWWLGRCWGRRR